MLERPCRGGDGAACLGLGLLLTHGRGGPRDAARGAELLHRACAAGVADACLQKAGERALADDPAARAEATAALRAGCAADAYACGPLGMLLATGLAGPPDVTAACDRLAAARDAGAREARRLHLRLCP